MSKLSEKLATLWRAGHLTTKEMLELEAMMASQIETRSRVKGDKELKSFGAKVAAGKKRQRHVKEYEKLKRENPTKDESWIRKQVAAENKVDRRTVERALKQK